MESKAPEKGPMIGNNILIALSAVYIFAYLAILQFILPNNDKMGVVVDVMFVIPLIIGLGGSVYALLRSQDHSRFWIPIIGALLAIVTSEVMLTYYLDVSQNFIQPITTMLLSNLTYVFYIVFPIMVLSRLYIRIKNKFGRLNLLTNLGMFFSTIISIFYVILISKTSIADIDTTLMPLAYAIFAMLMVYAIWAAILKITLPNILLWERYLFVALGAILLSDLYYLQAPLLSFSRHSSPFEAGWLLAGFCIAYSAYASTLTGEFSRLKKDGIASPPTWRQFQNKALGPLAIGSANLFIIYFITTRPPDVVTDTLSIYLGMTIALAVARYYLLVKENQILSSNTISDILTNVHSKDFFKQNIEQEVERSKRYKNNVALVLIDIDDYLKISSEYHYIRGEKILSRVAAAINFHLRKTDSIARVGEDEFALLLLEVPIDQIMKVIKRIKQTIEADVADAFPEIDLKASIGAAIFPESAVDHNSLFNNADKALKEAKQLGKNRSCVFQTDGSILSDR